MRLVKIALLVLTLCFGFSIVVAFAEHEDNDDDWLHNRRGHRHRDFHRHQGLEHRDFHEDMRFEHERFHQFPHTGREHRQFHKELKREHKDFHREERFRHRNFHRRFDRAPFFRRLSVFDDPTFEDDFDDFRFRRRPFFRSRSCR